MITRRRFVALAAASAFTPGLAAAGPGPAWPNRFVRVIVPFSAGVAPDVVARLLSARLSEMWGQQVLVENKPGAAGNIGHEVVARSAPDGHTVLMAAFTLAVNPLLYRSIGYDPLTSFAPVTLISHQPLVMLVPNSSPAHTVSEFIAHAKTSGGKMAFASAGHGTAPHLAGELFKRATGIEMMHVPYRSGAQQDLIAGRVDALFALAGTGLSLMRAGHARGLAVTASSRLTTAPDLATVAEAGVPGFEVTSWWGFFVPAKTSPSVVAKIHADTVAVLAEPAVKARLEQLGVTPVGSTPEELARHVKAEMEKWAPIIRNANIKIDG